MKILAKTKNFEFRLENFAVDYFDPKKSIGGKIFALDDVVFELQIIKNSVLDAMRFFFQKLNYSKLCQLVSYPQTQISTIQFYSRNSTSGFMAYSGLDLFKF